MTAAPVPIPGMRGDLVSGWYAAHRLAREFTCHLGDESRAAGRRALAAWWRRAGVGLGPASSLRLLFDTGVTPILEVLGFRVEAPRSYGDSATVFGRATAKALDIPVSVSRWASGLDGSYCRTAARGDGRWAMGFNGRVLRVWDTVRGWSRAYLDFDLETVLDDERAFVVFWALLRAEALAKVTADVAEASDRHGGAVRSALRDGVRDAVDLFWRELRAAGRSSRAAARGDGLHAQSLTLVYRLLFLLFAESRGLVPTWHPVYRRHYSIESLRAAAERPGSHRGLWASLQATWRMAHAGCSAGDLVVTPFNGRLFSPRHTPLAESARLDDRKVAEALVAMTTTPAARGRERISFSDLGVEQLGAVYESLIDHQPGTPALRASARKSSGTFYTPREMTDYLVRQALDPLVDGRTADQILALRVLDPAMGSGAFLVAACHHLADAYGRALEREQGLFPGEFSEADRARHRRLIAGHCLYGVDRNPMAVQVSRLSLWLATLAGDRPLSFLDHHLAVGDSLIGATLDDVATRAPGRQAGPRARGHSLPLFPDDGAGQALRHALPIRHRLASIPDDSVRAVRDKEAALAALKDEGGDLAIWRRLADLWCAAWFWTEGAGLRPAGPAFGELAAAIRGRQTSLRRAVIETSLNHAERVARDGAFFHWSLEFPEVFYDEAGRPRADGGFDAVVTNPPWEMMRADTGSAGDRRDARDERRQFVAFARESGLYPACGDGHPNLYQLFVERCLALTRAGGRLGLIVPWGLASDHGSAGLRRVLLERCRIDRLVAFDNARGLFPIHRGVRFLLVSASSGPSTTSVPCRFGERDPAVLDTLDREAPAGGTILLTPAQLRCYSGDSLAFPHVRSDADVRMLDRLCRRFPGLGTAEGWHASFGRELNATEDRGLMTASGTGLPVIEGKHLEPFVVNAAAGPRVPTARCLPTPGLRRAVTRWRLGYRDVASATNRLTLIAALIPPGHVTVHTVFCMRETRGAATQAFLCGVLNSFVANFVARVWVVTHVSATIVGRLPVPVVPLGSPVFSRIVRLSLVLRHPGPDWDRRYIRLQAAVAQLYGLKRDELAHVLSTFPLVPEATRRGCLLEFDAMVRR